MNTKQNQDFDTDKILAIVGAFLPSQAPLNHFIHHNTLHAFQDQSFEDAVRKAGQYYGFRVYEEIQKYRNDYSKGLIKESTLERVIKRYYPPNKRNELKVQLINQDFGLFEIPRIGNIRDQWKEIAHVNIEKEIIPRLFRFAGAFLDQGIAQFSHSHFDHHDLLNTIRVFESEKKGSVFSSDRVRKLIQQPNLTVNELLNILVGDPQYFHFYIEDALFAHAGWSGMVRYIEKNPTTLFRERRITLKEFLLFQLLLEIDILDTKLGLHWKPIQEQLLFNGNLVLEENNDNSLYRCLHIWQESKEFTYFESVINGLSAKKKSKKNQVTFQAAFCIDDRECSIRRHLERCDSHCETFGIAGYFNLPFYFLPKQAKKLIKVCPAPITPEHVISEIGDEGNTEYDYHLSNQGRFGHRKIWLPHFRGFWAAGKMAKSIFFPSPNKAMVSSFKHMEKSASLNIDPHKENAQFFKEQLKWGFNLEEQVSNFESMLISMGLTKNFAPFIYIIGHGASSTNNTHFAGYDCGACSGRSGSVNARIAALIGNKKEVRNALALKGIHIPPETQFIAGLHDTTQDVIEFYDTEKLNRKEIQMHKQHAETFRKAMLNNAVERSRKFETIGMDLSPLKKHHKVKLRSYSMFEPRPEWNHSNNALCIVGPRRNNKHLFFDRRAFLNSYEPQNDPTGEVLKGILSAVTPVCGGINLEYYFSSTDQVSLGAGSKLPHNVMGLIGVSNGIDGDLRTGLPEQMISIHNPLRMLVVVEQEAQIIEETLNRIPVIANWYNGEWMFLFSIDPITRKWNRWEKGRFHPYQAPLKPIDIRTNWFPFVSKTSRDLPVFFTEEVQYD